MKAAAERGTMRVLLGVDDSRNSDNALRMILSQFRPEATEIRVLHVVQPISVSSPPQMSSRFAPELEEQRNLGEELVDRAAKTLRNAGFKATTAVEQGDIRMKLIDSAKEWGADLVVVGSRGRGGIQRLLLGSVAEFVARHAPCSVEIVRDRQIA